MFRDLLRCAAVLSLLTLVALGQEFRATLTGRVTDPQKAAVPGAIVQARNVATNEVASATTNEQGDYTIHFLRPGAYSISIEHPGFKRYERQGITLNVAQTATLPIALEIGASTQVVTVSADVPLLEPDTASRGGVVDQQHVAELPLNSRNPFMLGAMMSGVTFRGASIWQRPFDNGAIAQWSINGGRQSNNEFLLDGAPNNGQAGGNNVAYVPIVDAVQEFRMQTNTYDAQYGHTGGGIMNVVLKTGGNTLHGSAWEFARRKWLDSNTFQNNATGAPRTNHYLDQYGVQLEGPVRLPGYDGRNKTFYLFSIENYREGTPTPLKLSVPEPEFLKGDFSKLVDANGKPITIYNPYDTTSDASGNPVRKPFPGNQIPASMINPIALKILGYFPQPNTTTPGQAYSQLDYSLPGYFARDKFYNLIAKVDQNIGDVHKMFFRYAQNSRTEDRNDNGVFKGPGQGGQQPFQRLNWAFVADWVGAYSPTFSANVRLSFNRFIEQGYGAGDLGFDLTSLGFPAATVNQLPGGKFFGNYNFQGYSYLGRYKGVNITNNYNLFPNVSKISGNHSLHAGVDIRRIQYILNNTGNIWRFVSHTDFTQKVWNRSDPNSGNAIASFLLGIPSEGNSDYPLFPMFRQWYYAPFVQDDWKVKPRLTLNLGVRWDFNLAPDEKYHRLNYRFDPNAASPLDALVNAGKFPQYANLKGGLTFTHTGGNPDKSSATRMGNIQPRIGAAFQLTPRLIMRGGYGRYYMNPGNDWMQTTGYSTSTPLVSSLDGGRTPVTNLLSNPYPSGILVPSGASAGLDTFVGRNFNWFDPTFKTPSVDQFSFGFQMALKSSASLDVSYVGSRGRNQQTQRDYNIPGLDFRKQCDPLEGGSPNYCNAQVANPFQGLQPFFGTSFYSASTLSRFQLNRPFPQFAGNLTRLGDNSGHTWYNSLQVNYKLRMRNGINLLADYTFSKFMERWGYLDPYRGIQQQGLYFLDKPHVFKLTTIYPLPFGHGHHFAGGASGWSERAIGGWELTTFFNAASGEPANLPGNVRLRGDPRLHPNFHSAKVQGWSPCVAVMHDDGSITAQPFSVAAGCGADTSTYPWLELPSYAPGELPFRSGQIRMYPTVTMDASLNKSVAINERMHLQARVEAFNVLNHYTMPTARYNTNPNDSNFGSFFPGNLWTGDTGFPRQIQLGLKLVF